MDYDLIVVGGGVAGSAAALRAAQYHLRVAWIRGDRFTANLAVRKASGSVVQKGWGDKDVKYQVQAGKTSVADFVRHIYVLDCCRWRNAGFR